MQITLSMHAYAAPASDGELSANMMPEDRAEVLSPFTIPGELGVVEEFYSAERRSYSVQRGQLRKNGIEQLSPSALSPQSSALPSKTVIYIQDAHDSLEAQENIAKIIHYLVEHEKVKTVLEEGYEGEVPTDRFFGFIQNKKIKKEIAYFLLDQLRIGGAEYAHINRSHDFKLIGADSKKWHDENILQYRKVSAGNRDFERDITRLEKELRRMADERFPKEIKELLKLKERFDQKEINLLDYVHRLSGFAGEQRILDEFPNISLLISLQNEDEEKAAKRARFLEAGVLYEELYRLPGHLAVHFLKNEADLLIFNYLQGLELVRRLSELKVTTVEYHAAKKMLAQFKTEKIAQFIFQQTSQPIILSTRWEENVRDAVRFYEIAAERDQAIERELEKIQEQSEEQNAVLVYGGFHKDGIIELLRRKHFSYVVITPHVSSLSEKHQRYYQRLMSNGTLETETLPDASRAVIPKHVFRLMDTKTEFRRYLEDNLPAELESELSGTGQASELRTSPPFVEHSGQYRYGFLENHPGVQTIMEAMDEFKSLHQFPFPDESRFGGGDSSSLEMLEEYIEMHHLHPNIWKKYARSIRYGAGVLTAVLSGIALAAAGAAGTLTFLLPLVLGSFIFWAIAKWIRTPVILDAGTGDGQTAFILAAYTGYPVVSIEADRDRLDYAKNFESFLEEEYGLRYSNLEIEQGNFLDQVLDGFSSVFFHWMPGRSDDDFEYAKRLIRKLNRDLKTDTLFYSPAFFVHEIKNESLQAYLRTNAPNLINLSPDDHSLNVTGRTPVARLNMHIPDEDIVLTLSSQKLRETLHHPDMIDYQEIPDQEFLFYAKHVGRALKQRIHSYHLKGMDVLLQVFSSGTAFIFGPGLFTFLFSIVNLILPSYRRQTLYFIQTGHFLNSLIDYGHVKDSRKSRIKRRIVRYLFSYLLSPRKDLHNPSLAALLFLGTYEPEIHRALEDLRASLEKEVDPDLLALIKIRRPEEVREKLEAYVLRDLNEQNGRAELRTEPESPETAADVERLNLRLVENPVILNLLSRISPSTAGKLRDFILSFLTRDYETKNEQFVRLDTVDDSEILRRTDKLLGKIKVEKDRWLYELIFSEYLGRRLTLRELIIHPTTGVVDLNQLLATKIQGFQDTGELHETITREGESTLKRVRYISKLLYRILRSLEILSRDRDFVWIRQEDVHGELFDFLSARAVKEIKTYGWISPGTLKNLLGLPELFLTLADDARDESLRNFIALIDRLTQERPDTWGEKLAEPEYQTQIEALRNRLNPKAELRTGPALVGKKEMDRLFRQAGPEVFFAASKNALQQGYPGVPWPLQTSETAGFRDYRPRNRENQPGGLVYIQNANRLIVIGDLHSRYDFLEAILNQVEIEKTLRENPDAHLIILGDAVHPIIKMFVGPEDDPVSRSVYGDSFRLLLQIQRLMQFFPGQVHYMPGNHDYAHLQRMMGGGIDSVGRKDIDDILVIQDRMMEGVIKEQFPEGSLQGFEEVLYDLPVVLHVRSGKTKLVFSHSGAAPGLRSVEQVINVQLDENRNVLNALLWNRNFAPAGIDSFLTVMDGQIAVGGHTPISDQNAQRRGLKVLPHGSGIARKTAYVPNLIIMDATAYPHYADIQLPLNDFNVDGRPVLNQPRMFHIRGPDGKWAFRRAELRTDQVIDADLNAFNTPHGSGRLSASDAQAPHSEAREASSARAELRLATNVSSTPHGSGRSELRSAGSLEVAPGFTDKDYWNWVNPLKQAMKQSKQDIWSAEVPVTRKAHRYGDLMDEYVRKVYKKASKLFGYRSVSRIALLGTGSYSRRDMHQGSDSDGMILLRHVKVRSHDEQIADAAEANIFSQGLSYFDLQKRGYNPTQIEVIIQLINGKGISADQVEDIAALVLSEERNIARDSEFMPRLIDAVYAKLEKKATESAAKSNAKDQNERPEPDDAVAAREFIARALDDLFGGGRKSSMWPAAPIQTDLLKEGTDEELTSITELLDTRLIVGNRRLYWEQTWAFKARLFGGWRALVYGLIRLMNTVIEIFTRHLEEIPRAFREFWSALGYLFHQRPEPQRKELAIALIKLWNNKLKAYDHIEGLYEREPHVKEGIGGMRALHFSRWVAQVYTGNWSKPFEALIRRGVIAEGEYNRAKKAHQFLVKLRQKLFEQTGQADILTLTALSEGLAQSLGFQPDVQRGLTAAEVLMTRYRRETAALFYFSTKVTRRIARELNPVTYEEMGIVVPVPGVRVVKRTGLTFRLKGGFQEVAGQLVLAPRPEKPGERTVQIAPEQIMPLFKFSAEHGIPFNGDLRDSLSQSRWEFTRRLRQDESFRQELHQQFWEFLNSKSSISYTLERMHHYGFLALIFPQFKKVQSLTRFSIHSRYSDDFQALKRIEFIDRLNFEVSTEEDEDIRDIRLAAKGAIDWLPRGDHGLYGVLRLAFLLRPYAELEPGKVDEALRQYGIEKRGKYNDEYDRIHFLLENDQTLIETIRYGGVSHMDNFLTLIFDRFEAKIKRWPLLLLMTLADIYSTNSARLWLYLNELKYASEIMDQDFGKNRSLLRQRIHEVETERGDYYADAIKSFPESEYSTGVVIDAFQGRVGEDVDFARVSILQRSEEDRPGRLAKITGALAANGLEVVAAKIRTAGDQNYLYDEFYVRDPRILDKVTTRDDMSGEITIPPDAVNRQMDEWIRTEKHLTEDLASLFDGAEFGYQGEDEIEEYTVRDIFARRHKPFNFNPTVFFRSSAEDPLEIKTRVYIGQNPNAGIGDHPVKENFTWLAVETKDFAGTLYVVSQALADMDINIEPQTRIDTEGNDPKVEVGKDVDAHKKALQFWAVNYEGKPLTPEMQQYVIDTIEHLLSIKNIKEKDFDGIKPLDKAELRRQAIASTHEQTVSPKTENVQPHAPAVQVPDIRPILENLRGRYAVVTDVEIFEALSAQQRHEFFALFEAASAKEKVRFIFNASLDRYHAEDGVIADLKKLDAEYGNVEVTVNAVPSQMGLGNRYVINISKEGRDVDFTRLVDEEFGSSKKLLRVRYLQNDAETLLVTAALLLLESQRAELRFLQRGEFFSKVPGMLVESISAFIKTYFYIGSSA
ncbi:MAG: metallophosphoesterase [Candidatus Omnitrophica bacterium]|nr:metallophosphoesterase [Candidatus Omnitrophota bacterium]